MTDDKDRPATDEEKAAVMEWVNNVSSGGVTHPIHMRALWAESRELLIRNLIAEVKRLRSDDWLERAAEEAWVMARSCSHLHILEILKKHRDGVE